MTDRHTVAMSRTGTFRLLLTAALVLVLGGIATTAYALRDTASETPTSPRPVRPPRRHPRRRRDRRSPAGPTRRWSASPTAQGARAAHVPRQPDPHLLRHRARCRAAARCSVAVPGPAACARSSRGQGRRPTNWCGTGWTGQPAVFERDGRTWVVFGAYDRAVHFLDAATGERHPARLPDRRHHQGLGHHRPRRLPARLHRLARQLLPRRSPSTAPSRPSCGSSSANAVSPTHVERRLGRLAASSSTTTCSRAARTASSTSSSSTAATDADGKVTVEPAAGVPRARLGRRAARTTSATERLDRELGRDLRQHRLLRQLRRPRAGLGHQRRSTAGRAADAGRSASGPATTPTRRSSSTSRACSTSAPSTSGTTPRSAAGRPDDEARPVASRTTRWCGRCDDQARRQAGVWATPGALRGHRHLRHRPAATCSASTGRPARCAGGSTLPGGQTWQSPVVVDDVLLHGDCAGVLHAYDVADTTADPTELWA